MSAKALLSHSVQLVLRDPKVAVRLTALPYVGSSVVSLLIVDVFGATEPPSLLTDFCALAIQFVGYAWMAVVWHRYILLDEGISLLPQFPAARVAAYLGYGAVFTLILLVPALSIALPLATIMVAGGGTVEHWGPQVLVYVTMFVAFVLFSRLTAILPAVALSPIDGLLAGWRATRGATFTMALVTLVLLVAHQVFYGIVSMFPIDTRAALFLDIMLQWPIVVLGVSLLTSTYLYYVKDQSLT